MAIVSVTAFACLLADQMAERLAYVQGRANSKPTTGRTDKNLPLIERVVQLIGDFVNQLRPSSIDSTLAYDLRFLGEFRGFISIVAPELRIEIEAPLDSKGRLRADAVISDQSDKVIIELKARKRPSAELAVMQVERYMAQSGISKAIVLLAPQAGVPMSSETFAFNGTIYENIVVMQPNIGHKV